MIAAAEPSETPLQSKTPSSPATSGDLEIVSMETSLRNWARGLTRAVAVVLPGDPGEDLLHLVGSTPYLCAVGGGEEREGGRRGEDRAGAVADRWMPVSPE